MVKFVQALRDQDFYKSPGVAETNYSEHQRSLLALAEVVSAPAPAGQATAGVDTHARDFLDQPQSP